MNITQFEFKRIIADKAIPIIFLLIALVVAVPHFLDRGYSFEEGKRINMEERYDAENSFIEDLKDNPDAQFVVEQTKKSAAALGVYLEKESINDEMGMLEAELAYEKLNLSGIRSGYISGNPLIDQMKLVAELEYLVEHNLLQVNYYDPVKPALNAVVALFSNYQLFLIIAALLMIYLATADRREDTIDFVNATPRSLFKLSAAKFSVQLLFGFLIGLVPIITTFLASLKNGLGSLEYPIITSGDSTNIVITPLSTVLIKALVLWFLIILFLGVVVFLISRFTGNIFLGAAILLGIILFQDYVPSERSFLEDNWFVFPSSYFDISAIILSKNGDVPLVNPLATWELGLIVQVAGIAALLLLLVVIIKKRQKI